MAEQKKITRQIEIEELVNLLPQSVSYLMEKGIRCLRCGEPIWGTLESASKEKGFNENEIEIFVDELNLLLENSYSLRDNQ
ncbi:MAG: DUF1858 domain-containing protein [Ignavibacteriales bacterium]|nr:DUF1858 domain-containing protein [Ignavibacteriales bacterium]